MRVQTNKSSRVIAYIMGLFVLSGSGLDTIAQVYAGAGMAWLLVWFLSKASSSGYSGTLDGDQSPQPFGRDYNTFNRNDANIIYHTGQD
ncbi:hypothetical protein KUV57_24475 [Epibacterium sp. DP7N7-1]|nr:hypothetical protein [Epibacterium sp. DP7N7-1]